MSRFRVFPVLCLAAGLLSVQSGISKAAMYLTVNGEDRDWVELLPSEVCSIEIQSTDNSVYGAFVGFEWAPLGAFVHTETRPEAGTEAGVFPLWNEPPFSSAYYVEALSFVPGGVQPGVHFVFLYHAEEFGQETLGLWDDYLNLVDSVSITVTWPGSGACCDQMTGYCYMSGEWDCMGMWLGPGTDCTLCQPPQGACFNPDTEECYISGEWECPYSWQGPGTDCSIFEPLTVTSPNGGEELIGSETYFITWLGGGSISDVLIEYSTNNGLSWNSIVTMDNSGLYNWVVPIVDSNQSLVRISDATNPSVSDVSDAVFTIARSAMSVASPNGGECLLADTTYGITWSNRGSISTVLIEYSTNNGLSWNTIVTMHNSGLYNWLVPIVDSNQSLVRISDATKPSVSDISDGVFTIESIRYSGGTGEPNNPYRVATPEDLNDIGNHSVDFNKHFVLINDIDHCQYTGKQFKIIGWKEPDSKAFVGIFDGNDHKILNFTYSSTDHKYRVGLFGYAGGQIKDLGLENVDVNAPNCQYVACLVGQNFAEEAIISRCYSTGNVSGGLQVGGLAGCSDGTIKNCYSTTNIIGNTKVGGLAGESLGEVTHCYSTGSVTGVDDVGGLVLIQA